MLRTSYLYPGVNLVDLGDAAEDGLDLFLGQDGSAHLPLLFKGQLEKLRQEKHKWININPPAPTATCRIQKALKPSTSACNFQLGASHSSASFSSKGRRLVRSYSDQLKTIQTGPLWDGSVRIQTSELSDPAGSIGLKDARIWSLFLHQRSASLVQTDNSVLTLFYHMIRVKQTWGKDPLGAFWGPWHFCLWAWTGLKVA